MLVLDANDYNDTLRKYTLDTTRPAVRDRSRGDLRPLPDAARQGYTWRLDLSGQSGNPSAAGIHGAGGIGGLLGCVEPQADPAPDKKYWFFHDANGNVGQILDATNLSSIAARYEYDPYGNVIAMDDPDENGYDEVNPFRFSTKWVDDELAGVSVNGAVGDTGLCYYGYRYYSPRLGRWLNRDPIEEDGGLSLYGFLVNDPIGRIDSHGLWTVYRKGRSRAIVESEGKQDNVASLARRIWLEPSEYREWLQPVDGGLPIPRGTAKRIPKGCRFTVPNRAVVHQGNIRIWFKNPGALIGTNDPFAVAEFQDIALFYQALGYRVGANPVASRADILRDWGDENLAVWAFVGHGGAGFIDPVDVATNFNLAAWQGVFYQHHKLADVILYACQTGEDPRWREMISLYGHIHWTEGDIRPVITDWEDLPEDIGRF